ncbi:MAG: biotin/lipoyl-containing protein, partial [Ornithinimicrobium sp.]
MSEAVFALPDLGEGLTSAEVVTWLVDEGDLIEIDQEIVTVETAKASVDVPSPYAGRVVRLHAQVGETVPVGSDLITVEPPADSPPAAGSAASARIAASAGTAANATAATDASELSVNTPAAGAASGTSGAVLIGYGTTELPPRVARKRRRRGSPGFAEDIQLPAESSVTAIKVISPLVRRAAAERGVDLRLVQPSGPHGIIRRADIGSAATEHTARDASWTPEASAPATDHTARHATSSPQASTPAYTPTPGATSTTGRMTPRQTGHPSAGDPDPIRIPLKGVRRAVAEKVSRSRTEIPDATAWVDVDATEFMAAAAAMARRRAHGRSG